MTERKITMQAIRHLAHVSEALNSLIYRGTLAMEHVPAAAERCMRCADHIEHLAGDDIEEVGESTRLQRIADSMQWLVSVRKEFDSELAASSLHFPSVIDLDATGATALAMAK
jgi:hypothetical protein